MKQAPRDLLFSRRELAGLILPLMAEQLLIRLMGMADSVMIAGVGETAMSAVSLVNSFHNVFLHFFTALTTGGAVAAGQYFGAKNEKKARQVSNQLFLLTLWIAAGITAVLFLFRDPLLHAAFGSVTEETMGFCRTYFTITLFSVPFIALYSAGAAMFRTMGDSRTPMVLTSAMNILNVAGNFLLIYQLHWGVAGAAVPTLLSRLAGGAAVLALLLRENYPLRFFRPFRFRLEAKTAKSILAIGIPNGVDTTLQHFGMLLVASLASSFGTSATAAYAVGNSAGVFQMLPAAAINLAVVPIISRCFGAGKERQVRYYAARLTGLSVLCNCAAAALFSLAVPLILQLYGLAPETETLAAWVLLFRGTACAFLWPPAFLLPSAFRATGRARSTMTVNILCMWIFQVGFSYLLAFLGFGPKSVWYGMAAAWAAQAICYLVRFPALTSAKWIPADRRRR